MTVRENPIHMMLVILLSTIAIYSFQLVLEIVFISLDITLLSSDSLTHKVLITLFVILIECIVIIYVFLRWFFHTYTTGNGSIKELSGIFIRRGKIFGLHPSQTIDLKTSVIGDTFGYGTIIIHNPMTQKKMVLQRIDSYQSMVNKLQAEINATDIQQQNLRSPSSQDKAPQQL